MGTPIDRRTDAWLAFASAAVSGYVPPDPELDEDGEEIEVDHDDFVDDVVDTACEIADRMTREFEARQEALSSSSSSKSHTNGRPARPRRRSRTVEEETE